MSWHIGVAYFFGGAFLANAIPHLISGISGKPLQSPFASPPFKGLSSAPVNVGWGLFNLAAAYVLLLHLGEFDVRSWLHAAVCFAGFGAMGLQCARSFGRLRRE
jgi:hypothetical protein